MEYYSAMIKNEILPFQQHGWTLRALYLSGIPERRILYDLTYVYLNGNLKNRPKHHPKLKDTEKRPAIADRGHKTGKGDQKVQTSIYTTNESWGCNI